MDAVMKQDESIVLAMVISIGGTPAPIIKSIMHYKPEFVSFLASQDTADNIADIKKAASETGFKSEITIVENVDDLLHCYNKADEAVMRVVKRNYEKDRVIVDYTGGTKNMSVALSLAAVTHGFSFSYVGGRERTKNGVGIVVDGQEEIYKSVNPWDFMAVEEKKKIALLFNQNQFKAAKDLVVRLCEKSTKYRFLFKKVGFLIDGYYSWDLFRHGEALDKFKKAKIEEILESEDTSFHKFAKESAEKQSFLEELGKNNKNISKPLILDLFANAERRFYEGKYDDSILRLYRLIEMAAQERLLNQYEIDTSDVKKEQIPDELRDSFIHSYYDSRENKIQIPQSAAFSLLKSLGDELGNKFESNKNQFLKIQSARNQSYLAHGIKPQKDTAYNDFRNFILQLEIFQVKDVPEFPKIMV